MTGSFLLAVLMSAPPPSGATPPAQGDEQLLKEHKVGGDGPALVAYFRKQTLSEADRRALAETVKRLGHRSFAEREKAVKALLDRGAAAVPFLRDALADPDLEVVRRAEHCLAEIDRGPGSALPAAAARLLARKAPPEAVAVLLAYLPQAAEESVEEAILDALVALTPAKAKPDPALTAALTDTAALRRLAAAHVLGRRGDEAVRPLLKDPDVRVRYHAAQALLLGRDRTALPVLLALLTDAPPALAWQVEETLFRLAGEQGPAVSLGGTAEDRKKARDAWEKWADRNAARIDLARLRDGERLLGLTLVIEYSSKRISECGPDGTERWAITELTGPMEAWVLPGNRVLVADDSGVTERDFKGQVLWKLTQVSGVTGAQRLPGGNTFVSTYSSVMEFDKGGKQLYQHTIPGSNAIRKHKNGNIVYATDSHIVEVDTANKKVREVPLPKESMWVGIEDLPGGRFVVANSSSGRVIEVDAMGKVHWEGNVAGACGVTRLPNGHTLVATNGRVVELDRGGKIVWERKTAGYARRVHRR